MYKTLFIRSFVLASIHSFVPLSILALSSELLNCLTRALCSMHIFQIDTVQSVTVIISKPYVKFKDLKQNCTKKIKRKSEASYCICLFFSNKFRSTFNTMS